LATGRPLLSLAITDLFSSQEIDEKLLSNWFYLAERWKALILLDEADIFLEKRQTKDISRNAIVSGKQFSGEKNQYFYLPLRITKRE
jgi:hypothetical protein